MSLFSTPLSDGKPWFLSLFDQLWDRRHPRTPLRTTAQPLATPEIWSHHRARMPRLLSLAAHLTFAVILLIPRARSPERLPQGMADVVLYLPARVMMPLADEKSGGGGGGGRHQPAPASFGRLPRPADRQMVPPDPDPPKNPDPTLIVESTVVAPQLAFLPQLNLLPVGDPTGIPGPPSSGPGSGPGIGDGDGRGVGPGRGPGVGDGDGGGFGGDTFAIGGGVSAPVLVSEILPEYSEEARRARFQGTVVLDTIVLQDGSVKVLRVRQSPGFGLDDKAVNAVLQWKFRPGRKNGRPVAVPLFIEVRFNLR